MMLHNVEFVIITNGRTGSTALKSRLNRHPDIKCQHELLSPASRKKFGQEADLSTEDKLEQFFDLYLDGEERCQGFKLLYSNLSLKGHVFGYTWIWQSNGSYVADIIRRRMKVIHLTRNFLDLYLSAKLACAQNIWAVTPIVQKSEEQRKLLIKGYNKPITIDCQEFLDHIDKYEASKEMIRRSFDIFELDYDDILGDLEELQKWIGCSPMELELPKTSRQRQLPKNELITNFDELAMLLRDTQHEWMLNESLP